MPALTLQRFGSYTVGGRVVEVAGEAEREIRFTRSTAYRYDPNGHFPVEHAYVQYFEPPGCERRPPVVLLHGGGMSGAMWESTPDGRPGWLHGLLTRGYAVHVVDNVERGRAGWKPGLWPDPPILRSIEEAWVLFRFGARGDFAARRAYPKQQFPVEQLENFARGFVPRWTSTGAAHSAALIALLERLGRSIIICHSAGAQAAFDAAAARPETVEHLLAVEPSGFCGDGGAPTSVPVTLLHGDYLDRDDLWRGLAARWRELETLWGRRGGRLRIVDAGVIAAGASHMLMMDANAEAHLALALDAAFS